MEVNYETLPGRALNVEDYQTWSVTLAFNEGEKEKEINIIIIDDKKIRRNRIFLFEIK